jgi:hypothetical protein
MGQTISVISGKGYNSEGQLKGSTRGACISAVFGCPWIYWAVVFSGNPKPLWFLIVTVASVLLVTWSIFRLRAVRHLAYSAAELAHWRASRKLFWVDFGVEWGLVSIAVFVLARFGRFDLIPQALGVIIGLHFLPLARVFRLSRYYWMGSTMVIAELGSLLIHPGYIRNIFACAAIGLTLWTTSVAVLYRTSPGVAQSS